MIGEHRCHDERSVKIMRLDGHPLVRHPWLLLDVPTNESSRTQRRLFTVISVVSLLATAVLVYQIRSYHSHCQSQIGGESCYWRVQLT